MSKPDSQFTVEQFFCFLEKNLPRFLGFLDCVYPLLVNAFVMETSCSR